MGTWCGCVEAQYFIPANSLFSASENMRQTSFENQLQAVTVLQLFFNNTLNTMQRCWGISLIPFQYIPISYPITSLHSFDPMINCSRWISSMLKKKTLAFWLLNYMKETIMHWILINTQSVTNLNWSWNSHLIHSLPPSLLKKNFQYFLFQF